MKFYNVKWPGTPGEFVIDPALAGPKILVHARALWLDAEDGSVRMEHTYDARAKKVLPVGEFLALQEKRRRERAIEFARHFERRRSERSKGRRAEALAEADPLGGLGWSVPS